ncbi:hypothetical protein NQ318_017445 [Aromia moschata]|uniref:Uncharacterized protein n=1 Tax=Aromia moschata TaxID=1265417 RepID=A0AAV8Z4R6_9CUCU|nr:hypothetical protein NQ318_017445 [Aromia moschata]
MFGGALTAERECSSLYGAMQQQAFYFISRKYVHDVQQCSSLYRGSMQQQAFYFISRKYVHDVQQK